MRKKIIVGLVTVAFLVSLICQSVYAANECVLDMVINKRSVKRGEVFNVIINMNDINISTGGRGVGAFKFHLNYDENKLEFVNVIESTGWDKPVYSENEVISVRSDGECTSSNQSIVNFSFKVKDNAAFGDTEIKVDNLFVTDGVSEIPVSTSSASNVEIYKDEEENTNTVANTVANTVSNTVVGNDVLNQNIVNMLNNTQTNTATNTSTNTDGHVDNTSISDEYDGENKLQVENLANKKLPQTGSKIVVPAIAIVLIIVCVAYFNYRKMKVMNKLEKENKENK